MADPSCPYCLAPLSPSVLSRRRQEHMLVWALVYSFIAFKKILLLLFHYMYSCAPSAAPPRAARQVPGQCRRAQRGAQVHSSRHQPPGSCSVLQF